MNRTTRTFAALSLVLTSTAFGASGCAGTPDEQQDDGVEVATSDSALSVGSGVCGGTATYPWAPSEVPGGADALPTPKRKVQVSSNADLKNALSNAKEGDLIVLANGTYSASFASTNSGKPGSPIVIMAQNPLGAVFTSDFSATGDYTVVSGVVGKAASLIIGGKGSRLTRSKVTDYQGRRSIEVALGASFVRVDHNEIANYHQQGVSLTVDPGKEPNHIWIDHNSIHDRLAAPKGTDPNIDEAIQLGESIGTSAVEVHNVIESNLVTNNTFADDAISLKSSASIVCGNTLIDAKGGITARQGHDNVILGNFLVNTMLKIHDSGHQVIGNVLQGGTLQVFAGDVPADSPTSVKPRAGCNAIKAASKDVLIAANKGKLTVGNIDDTEASCFTFDATDVRIEAHDPNDVNIDAKHSQNVKQSATTTAKSAPAVKLTSSDVGPLSP